MNKCKIDLTGVCLCCHVRLDDLYPYRFHDDCHCPQTSCKFSEYLAHSFKPVDGKIDRLWRCQNGECKTFYADILDAEKHERAEALLTVIFETIAAVEQDSQHANCGTVLSSFDQEGAYKLPQVQAMIAAVHKAIR